MNLPQANGSVESLLWTSTYVYIFKVAGLMGINTERLQGIGDSFPERGMSEVSADVHLACCTIRRIHYGYPEVEDTVTYKVTDWVLLPDQGSVKLKLGDSDAMLNAFNQKLVLLANKLPVRPDGFPASAPKPVVQPTQNVVTTQSGASTKIV